MPEHLQSPLYQLLNQINFAANNGLHLLAIGMAVALPDLCASLSKPDGRSGGKDYKKWCAANLTGSKFSYVTPEDLYSIRCGVLHQGRFGGLTHNVARVIFVPPANGGSTFVNCIAEDAYFYSVVDFCRNLCDAAFSWYEAHRDEPLVKSNTERMMRYYPNGLSPYIGGAMVIA